jgi:hypothetical protein
MPRSSTNATNIRTTSPILLPSLTIIIDGTDKTSSLTRSYMDESRYSAGPRPLNKLMHRTEASVCLAHP